MGKIVVEKGTIDFEPVGVKAGCGRCPSGCRTVCQRQHYVKFDLNEGDMKDFKLVPIEHDYGSFRKKKPETEGEESK
jgi:hypothetical protein